MTDTYDADHHESTPDSSHFTRSKYANTIVTKEQIGIVGGFQLALCGGICLTVETLFDLEVKMTHMELHVIHFANNLMEGKIVDLEAFALKPLSHYIGAAIKAWVAANAGIDWDSIRPLA